MRFRGWMAITGAAFGLLASSAPLAARPAAGPTVVGCSQAADRVQITADAVLDPTCTYTGGFDITASDVTLDCNGALVQDAAAARIGIWIHAPAADGQHDVTVTNCRVEGFLNNLRITRDGFGDFAPGHEYDTNTAAMRVTDSEFSGSRGVGIYIDAFVSDATITGNDIHDTGSSGIYLETGSRANHIEGNSLVHDGYTENGTQGQTFEVGGTTVWYWGTGREGIAIDGSYDNVIRGNHFERNSLGGILLYKNCGENKDDPSWIPRRWAARRNLIEGNDFTDERTGVWVGSRMGENTLPMDCSDPAYVDRPGVRVTLDRAPDNTIRTNTFDDVTYGIRVEDDGTTIEGNRFTASTADHHPVIIGTPYRTDVLHQPVRGTVLRGNHAEVIGNDSPYRWVHGQEQTTVSGNTALGRPTGICEGRPPPRQLFVMVVAVAAALPDGSKPPTPDLTIHTLGALPSCQPKTSTTTTTTASTPAGPVAPPAATPVSGTASYTG